ncbi:MAG: biopolymer transporter ExbD [Kiritimatiellae bacterium]|jgi:biopolymer transport protein ExbD|nr:biopolymer transporter ExbD [Kiritimatiellia bacterium]
MAEQPKKQLDIDTPSMPLNLGPLIDIVSILLLYYIVCSTFETTRVSREVILPFARQGLKEEDTSGRFVVNIEWNEGLYEASYLVNGMKTSGPAEMTTLIMQGKKSQGNPRNFRVVLRADRRVPYEFTQQAMAAVAEADVGNILFSTTEDIAEK